MSDDSPEDEEYVVEAIRAWRYHYTDKCKQYFIKWLNYSEEENTWEPEDHLCCRDLLDKFIEDLPPDEKKNFHSARPDKLSGFERNANYVSIVGVNGPHASDRQGSAKVDKQKFYCLLKFDDSDLAEEVTVNEFFEAKPSEALEFFEERVFVKNRV